MAEVQEVFAQEAPAEGEAGEPTQAWTRDAREVDPTPSTRTYVVEPLIGEDGSELGYDRELALSLLQDLEAMLFRHGGMFAVTVEREIVGAGPNGEALGRSRRMIVQSQSYAPVRKG